MSRRFGKARVPNCRCETNLTCRPCLEGAPAYHFTPHDALRHHVSGAIERGEAVAIVEKPAPSSVQELGDWIDGIVSALGLSSQLAFIWFEQRGLETVRPLTQSELASLTAWARI